MAFADNLKQLPGVSHLAAIELLDDSGATVGQIENKAGQAGSLVVYNHLAQLYGAVTPRRPGRPRTLRRAYRRCTGEPGKHPNIDRLIRAVRARRIAAGEAPLRGLKPRGVTLASAMLCR